MARSAMAFSAAEVHVKTIGGSYADNWARKNKECQEMLAKCRKDLSTVYYAKEDDPSTLTKPDPQNFVSLESQQAKLDEVPALDDKLRHLVPPAVRALQEELKQHLQGIVQAEYTKIQ